MCIRDRRDHQPPSARLNAETQVQYALEQTERSRPAWLRADPECRQRSAQADNGLKVDPFSPVVFEAFALQCSPKCPVMIRCAVGLNTSPPLFGIVENGAKNSNAAPTVFSRFEVSSGALSASYYWQRRNLAIGERQTPHEFFLLPISRKGTAMFRKALLILAIGAMAFTASTAQAGGFGYSRGYSGGFNRGFSGSSFYRGGYNRGYGGGFNRGSSFYRGNSFNRGGNFYRGNSFGRSGFGRGISFFF